MVRVMCYKKEELELMLRPHHDAATSYNVVFFWNFAPQWPISSTISFHNESSPQKNQLQKW